MGSRGKRWRNTKNEIIIKEDVAIIIPTNSRTYPDKVILLDRADLSTVSEYSWNIYAQNNGKTFYAKTWDDGIKKLHTLLIPDADVIDHINFDGLDNRRINLRPCSKSQNSSRARRISNSGYRGVYKKRNRYEAQIKVNGKIVFLGCFKCPKEAAKIYDTAALKYFGEWAILNMEVRNV